MKSFRLTYINMKQQAQTLNFYIPFILAFIVFIWTTEPIKKTVIEVGYNINSFFVVFMTSNPLIVLIFFLGEIILFAKLPFRDKHQPFLLIRCGKMRWILSQLLYVMVISLIYPLIMILLIWLCTSTEIYFDWSNWGKIINSLCEYTIAGNIVSVNFNKFVVARLSPAEAMGYFTTILFLLGYMIGCIQLFFNLISKRYFGNLFVTFLIFLFLFSQFASGVIVTWISPMSWTDFYELKLSDSLYPPFEYAIIVSLLIDFVLTLCCLLVCQKKSKVNLA